MEEEKEKKKKKLENFISYIFSLSDTCLGVVPDSCAEFERNLEHVNIFLNSLNNNKK